MTDDVIGIKTIPLKKPQYQSEMDKCLPACVKTVLEQQLGVKNSVSMQKITAACGYRYGIGTASDIAIEGLTSMLAKYGLSTKHAAGTGADLSLIIKLVSRGTYPIAEVSHRYFKLYKPADYVVQRDIITGHHIVVLGVSRDNSTIFIFDPFEKYIMRKGAGKFEAKISGSHFLSCWGEKERQVIWFESAGKMAKKASAGKILVTSGQTKVSEFGG